MGLLEILTIIFVVLKVFAIGPVAAWGWIWCFAPLWIGYPVIFIIWFLFAFVSYKLLDRLS